MNRILILLASLLLVGSHAISDETDDSSKYKGVIEDARQLVEVIDTFYAYCIKSLVPASLGMPSLWEMLSGSEEGCSIARSESLLKSVQTFKTACEPCFFGEKPIVNLSVAEAQMKELEFKFHNLKRLVDGELEISESLGEELQDNYLKLLSEEQEKSAVEEAAVSAFGAVAWAIKEHVSNNWDEPGDFAGLSVAFLVKVDRQGNVLSVKMTRSSGDARLDESAENAIFKASPLPFPDEERFYEYLKEFNFVFKP